MASSFLARLAGRSQRPSLLRNARTGSVLATTLEPAFDSHTRRKGLLGRADLAEGAALILAPCSSIHTCFMRFPIDVIYVSRDGGVVRLREHLAPWRISGARRAFAVIELRAGTIARSGTRAGDVLLIEDR